MIYAILLMPVVIAATIRYVLKHMCPQCGTKLETDDQGFRYKWACCPNCGYCTFIGYAKDRES